jgi:hypothetical protein
MQAMEFQEIENLCQHAFTIHQSCNELGYLEGIVDRKFLALIFSTWWKA